MAIERKPDTPYDPDRLNNPIRTNINPTRTTIVDNDGRSPAELDNDLQIDSELAEGPASNTRDALFAVGIAVVLGVVFYGLNHSPLHQQASTAPPPPASSQTTASTSPPAAPPGMREVTPHPNSQPGTTTGAAAAPANPQKPSPALSNPGGANTNNANPGNAPARQ
ncbi:MAG: hypothetical protein WBQ22_14315 [Bradyrhizobium sp.]